MLNCILVKPRMVRKRHGVLEKKTKSMLPALMRASDWCIFVSREHLENSVLGSRS